MVKAGKEAGRRILAWQALIAKYSQPVSSSPNPGSELARASTATASADAAFAREILPIFQKSCIACHSGDKPKGGLDLGNVANLLKGGQSGQPAIVGMVTGQRAKYSDQRNVTRQPVTARTVKDTL